MLKWSCKRSPIHVVDVINAFERNEKTSQSKVLWLDKLQW